MPLATSIVITMNGEPQGKGRPRFARGHAYTPQATRNYETALKFAAQVAMRGREILEGPLKIEVFAGFGIPKSWSAAKSARALIGTIRPTGKPDIDNVLKAMDALNGIVWRDDAQVVTASISKRYTDNPRLRIEVERLWTGADA
jgi:Holliday junction resolvase RusA-like endonuclease